MKLKILSQPLDEILMMTDSRYQNNKANEDCIFLKHGLLFRKYFGETVSVQYHRILIPKQLAEDVLRSLHGDFGKHTGIAKTKIAYRVKYFPKMAQLIRERVMSCEKCIKESRTDRSLTHPPLQNPNERITVPEDAMQLDLLPELTPSGSYENIVTALDVSSRYLFAYPTSNQDAKTFAEVIITIVTVHAYLPKTLISDKGTSFMSHVSKEMASVFDITLKHATTKHAQTIGLLGRSHASIRQAIKIETGERRSLWHRVAVLNYNTSYHTSIDCEPGRVFHDRIAYNILGLKLGIRPQQAPIPTSQIAQDVLDQTEMIYIKYKACYDKKANASKLKQADYVYVLQPKADHQESKLPFTEFRWFGPYIIAKLLPNNNYLVPKVRTNKTQVLRRMQMRQFTPRQPPADIRITPQEWKPDPEVRLKHDDLYARAWECEYEQLIFDAESKNAVPPNSPEIPLQSDLSTEEMGNTPATAHECSPETFPQTGVLSDVTDTYPDRELDVETSSEQPEISPTGPRSSIYNLRHNLKPKCNDDYGCYFVS